MKSLTRESPSFIEYEIEDIKCLVSYIKDVTYDLDYDKIEEAIKVVAENEIEKYNKTSLSLGKTISKIYIEDKDDKPKLV